MHSYIFVPNTEFCMLFLNLMTVFLKYLQYIASSEGGTKWLDGLNIKGLIALFHRNELAGD